MQINLDLAKKYLLGCSYGPDSMVLFDLLHKGGYTFSVAHVNYKLRGAESDNETTNLINYAESRNIKIFTKFVDGNLFSGNFQSKARSVRYTFFKEVMAQEGFDVLLTAHHLDDHLETYLMQKNSKRKTFYYGIKAATTLDEIVISRPLLNYEKAEIIAYARKENVPYSVDSSNLKTKYTRNKIRFNIIKNMNYADKMALKAEIDALNTKVRHIEKEVTKLLLYNSVSIKTLLSLDEEKREYLLYLMFQNVGLSDKFSKAKSDNIYAVARSSLNSLMHKVSGNIYLVKYEGKIKLFNESDYTPYKFVINSPKTLKTVHFSAYFDISDVKPLIDEKEYPLTITTISAGDYYQIKDYTKSVNRLFVDMKLPRHYRLIWPLVKNKDGKIIYIPRYRQDYEAKPTDLFKINLK